MFMLIVVYLR